LDRRLGMRILKPFIPKCEPHLLVTHPTVTDDVLTTASRRHNRYIMCRGNVPTDCLEAKGWRPHNWICRDKNC